MVSGVEMLIGVRDDAQVGPFMMIGLGGIHVEVLRDVALRLLPVTVEDVHAMLAELRGHEFLQGVRGHPPSDIPALAATAVELSRLFLEQRGSLKDIEINPLIVGPAGTGAWAVDVRPISRDHRVDQPH